MEKAPFPWPIVAAVAIPAGNLFGGLIFIMTRTVTGSWTGLLFLGIVGFLTAFALAAVLRFLPEKTSDRGWIFWTFLILTICFAECFWLLPLLS